MEPKSLIGSKSEAGEVEQKILPDSKHQLTFSFASTVRKVAPAVVNIYASRLIRSRSETPFFEDPIFKHFFGDAFPQDKSTSRVQNSLGSGVLVKPEGVVITNLHVIKDAEEIKVVLSDGREFSAEVVVRDARTDLAALKLSLNKNVT
ncbi:MAG: S1C family serine protease, partial [Alphaproteobacteria bacterium]|nr:S1C family serine protease [Alphaproteobacteria bacterium]